MIATQNYGLIKKSHTYSIIAEGCDWYLARIRGQVIYVPKRVFEYED